MAACSLGASSFKIRHLSLGYGGPKVTRSSGVKTRSLVGYNGLVISPNTKKPLIRRWCLGSEAQSSSSLDGNLEKAISSDGASPLVPNSNDVESFLAELCDTTSIAEIELKLGDFQLYVMRNLNGHITTSHPPISVPVSSPQNFEMPSSNGSAPAPSLAITKLASSDGIGTLLDKAADEGLVIIRSPRVGFFRRSRTIKGKRAPPSCKEKQQVKEGQVICYIEQLGGELPVESEVSGEVIKVLLEDGAPVGYGDPIISILPSFPGIKI
ncbi:uncharacterized protein LOC116010521 [Ipomoea triloba]|uniref:uncharacterized protein LOC116010521 n=1 Tax=Ipomoea triloba TaxID=35885 RepID=UPI00125E04C5|nr:uncharacterized protein LOC116010521 [Ipomoea triloba]